MWLGYTRRHGRPGIVMEFMPRGSLWGFLGSSGRGGRDGAPPAFSVAQQRAVALDIACGMAYLHALPILHLDLKVSGMTMPLERCAARGPSSPHCLYRCV